MTEGAWIFLFHSHKDFDKVSGVRNVLEGHGHHPLMFFLKCLGDDDEIDGLIRREISARRVARPSFAWAGKFIRHRLTVADAAFLDTCA